MWVKYGEFEFDTKDVGVLRHFEARKEEAMKHPTFGMVSVVQSQEEHYLVFLRGVPNVSIAITPDQREDLLRKMKVAD